MKITKSKTGRYLLLLIASILLVTIYSQESPIYKFSLWPDINCWLAIGRALKKGQLIYTDVYDHKGPLFYIIIQLISYITDKSFLGFYILEVILLYIFTIYNYKISNILLKDDKKSFIVSIITLIASLSSLYLQETFVPELIFLSIFQYAIYLYINRIYNNIEIKNQQYIIIGIHIAIILSIKYNLTILYLLSFISLIIFCNEFKNIKYTLTKLAITILSFITIILLILSIYYIKGNLQEMIQSYILDNINYAFSVKTTLAYKIYKFIIVVLGSDTFCNLILALAIIKSTKILQKTILIVYLPYIILVSSESLVTHYKLIPILGILVIGIIETNNFLIKHLSRRVEKIAIIILFILVFTRTTNLFTLFTDESEIGQYKFAEIINKDKDNTLMISNVLVGDNSVINLCNITPNVKYFTTYNFIGNKYNEIRSYQEHVMDRKLVKYIVSNTPIEHNNYKLVCSYEFLEIKPVVILKNTNKKVLYYLYRTKE